MRKTIGLALVALVAGVALIWHVRGPTTAAPEQPALTQAAAAAPQSSSPRPAGAPPPAIDSRSDPRAPATAYPVNLDALRRRIPDNLYWTLGAPTDDQEMLRQREERGRRSNQLYGKVLASEASEEEIQRYYAERRRVSEDYIKFAELVLAEYRDQLPDDQVSLYELSIQLNRGRLTQIARDLEDALARRRARKK